MNSEYIIILVTAANREEAIKIADALLAQRKAACVNIIPKVSSMFWWGGKVERTEENLLIIKSRTELFDEVVSSVKAIHSYEVPEIIALPVIKGSTDYLSWVTKETETKSGDTD